MRLAILSLLGVCFLAAYSEAPREIGSEKAIPRHLQDGEECEMPMEALIRYGKQLFEARFTVQDGFGRPLT